MKSFLKFFLLFILGVIAGIVAVTFKPVVQTLAPTAVMSMPRPVFSIEDAPSESIKGKILQIAGNIDWESRTATVSSKLIGEPALQQGEEIQTGDNGRLTVDFSPGALININPKTQIDFVQTLPVNFVVSIASGSATFKKVSDIPVSIRALHLLIKQESGNLDVEVDTDNSIVNLNILNGSITIAYNDSDLNSHETTFQAGQKVSFNDQLRRFK